MTSRQQLEFAFTQCVKELNKNLPSEQAINDSPDMILIGDGSALDSLSIVNLLVNLEERVESETGIRIDILDAVFAGDTLLATRAQIVDYLGNRV